MKVLLVQLFLLLIISTIDISDASPVSLQNSEIDAEQQPSEVLSRPKRFITVLGGVLSVLGLIGAGIGVSASNRQQEQSNHDMQQEEINSNSQTLAAINRNMQKQAAINRDVQADMNSIKQTLAQFTEQFSQFTREINELETTMESKFLKLKAELDKTKDTCAALGALIENKSMWHKQVAIFGRDVQRLQYLLMLLNDRLDRDKHGRIIVNARAEEWAQAVLSKRDDGVDQILMNLDHMVMGKSPIFLSQSIVKLCFQGLQETDTERWNKMDRLKETLHSLQAAGYVFWATALSIMNRTEDVNATVLPLARERLDKQDQAVFKLYQPRMWQWPAGTYGLLKVTGQECPEGIGEWKNGYRQQDLGYAYMQKPNCSEPFHGSWSGGASVYNRRWTFCTKTSTAHDQNFHWPAGTYCIFSKSGVAKGFKQGWIFWDDGHNNDIGSSGTGGTVPDGVYHDVSVTGSAYDDTTQIYFSCRHDRSPEEAIQLPVQKPFMLFPLHGYINEFPCQKVEGMKATEEWFQYNIPSLNEGNKFEWPHPKKSGTRNKLTLHYCYYEPL